MTFALLACRVLQILKCIRKIYWPKWLTVSWQIKARASVRLGSRWKKPTKT